MDQPSGGSAAIGAPASGPARADAPRGRFDERLLDAAVLALAAWTLACNLAVWLGAGFDRLFAWTAGGALPLAAALLAAWGLGPAAPPGPGARALALPLPGRATLLAGLALGAGCTLLVAGGASLLVAWWVLVLGLAAAWIALLRRDPRSEPGDPSPARSAGGTLALWLLAAGCGAFAVTVHAVSPDDAYYVNVAVAALDRPELPLLRHDTLHGIEGAPAMYTVYRVHSHELLIALVARLLRLPAVQAAHMVLPALFGTLVVLSLARLVRRLAPRTWLLTTAILVATLLLVADTEQSYGQFTFLRLQQGKAVFLGLLAPAILLHGLAFGERPSWRSGALLAAAQIASVGMTSTALWCAPALGGLALVAGATGRRGGLRHVLAGAPALLHPLLLGLAFHGASAREVARSGEEGVRLVRVVAQPLRGGAELVEGAWRVVLGSGPFSALCLLATSIAWVLAPSRAARALALVLPLGTLVLLLDPYVALDVADSVTGGITYWRVLWVLPVPLLLALVLAAPASLLADRAPRLGRGLAAVLAAACLALLPQRHVLDPANRIMVAPLAMKAYAASWWNATALVLNVPRGAHVLASRGVATSLPMIHNHPWPLVVRRTYVEALAPRLGEREVEERLRLYDYVSGVGERSERELLERALRRYPLAGVSLLARGPHAAEIRAVLGRAGLQRVAEKGDYETWTTLERQRERLRAAAARAAGD